MSGMALQCPGWRCGGGDGCIGPMVTEETRLTGPASRRRPGRVWNRRPSHFRGFHHPLSRVQRPVRTRVGSTVSWKLTPALPHSAVQWRGWPYRECWRNSAVASFPGVLEVWCGFVFDLGACMCQSIKFPGRGSRYGGGEPVGASSEAETRSRWCPAPERGRTLLMRCCTPRAKRSLARGWLGLTVLVDRWGLQDRGPLFAICDCLGVFCVGEFVYVSLFANESGFSLVI
jgi:hypothetical protein